MEPKATAKAKTATKARIVTTKCTNLTTTSKSTKKTKVNTVKTRAVIFDSDNDATEEEEMMASSEEDEDNTVESFKISRGRKLSVGCFNNGDAFVDIRESQPRKKISKRLRRGRGICLTMTQWRKILGLLPEIEKSINKVTSQNET